MNDRERLRRIAQITTEALNRYSTYTIGPDRYETERQLAREELNEIYRLAARLDTVRPAYSSRRIPTTDREGNKVYVTNE
jgi:hypothetical protein